MACQMRRRLHHAADVARGAYAPAFAGEGREVVVRAVSAAGAGKAVVKDATFEVFAKCLEHIGLGGALDQLQRCEGELVCPGAAPTTAKLAVLMALSG